MSIEIRSLGKRFGNFVAPQDINLDIPGGELVALLGPSGCGKTTLLRIIAGMESADTGQVLFAGEEATHLHARERNVGFVFQHYALFRHMSVFENVAFGLRVRPRATRPAEAAIRMTRASIRCEAVDDVYEVLESGAPWLTELDRISCPTLVAWGSKDRILPAHKHARRLALEIPGLQYRTLHGLGHIPMWDAPELVGAMIRDHVQRSTKAA